MCFIQLFNSLTNYAAAAAKPLQSCLTLCDPIDGSPPGSPVLGILQQEHWSGLPFPSPSSQLALHIKTYQQWDFPGASGVKNPPCNSGDVDSIPGQGTNIPHAMGQLNPLATTREARTPQ